MLILILILLSNCNKLNFPKDSKFYSNSKTNDQDLENGNLRKRNVEYVIEGKIGEFLEEEKSKSKFSNSSLATSVDYLESTMLLEIQEAEQKAYHKETKEFENKFTFDVDYSESSTLLEIQEAEQKAHIKQEKVLEEDEKKSSNYYNNCFESGYMDINKEENFSC